MSAPRPHALALGVLLVGACGSDGAVRIVIEDTADPALSAIDDRLASMTLIVEAEGAPPQVERRAVMDRDRPLDLGEIQVGEGVRLTLEATSATGRLVGYGRSTPGVDVAGDAEVLVPIRMRRPYAYVAGDAGLHALDATRDRDFDSILDLPAPPTAVATTSDGAEVVVATGHQLLLVSTSTHLAGEASVELAEPAVDLAVSRDDEWIAAAHASGVSLIRVADLRGGGGGAAAFEAIGAASSVEIVGDRAWFLLDAGTDCAAASALGSLPLGGGAPEGPVSLGVTGRDLAVDGASGALYLAAPCLDRIVRVEPDGDGTTVTDMLELPSPTTVAVQDGRIWALGRTPAKLVLGSIGVDGRDRSVFEQPLTEERAGSETSPIEGQSVDLLIEADSADALDLAVLPGGRHLFAIVEYRYESEEIVDPIWGTIFPTVTVVTRELQLLDSGGATAALRMRASCQISWAPGAYVDRFWCTSPLGVDTSLPTFLPTRAAALYGAR